MLPLSFPQCYKIPVSLSPFQERRFINQGWDFSGQADVAAKAGTDGDELSGAVNVMPGVSVYQLTESGLALQVTLQGTKYWKDADLN